MTRQIVLCERPYGQFRADQMSLRSVPLATLQPGELLVRVRWLSLDPLIRIRISADPLGGALPPLPVGDPVTGPAVGEVVKSADSAFPVRTLVEGRFPWQDYATIPASSCKAINTRGLPPQAALGLLGLPGFTAFTGLEIARRARPSARKLVISGAAGAVGSIAAQLAKAAGMHVTGIANGRDRCAYLIEEIGIDAAIDRSDPGFLSQLDGIHPYDVYFDNVGGPMLAEVAARLARSGLILICGLMAQYNRLDRPAEPLALEPFLEAMMGRQLELRAFSTALQGRPQSFLDHVVPLIEAGRLHLPEIVSEGLEQAPEAFESVFAEGGIGKQLVRLDG